MFELHPQLKADTILIGTLPLCQVLLMNDSQYPWIILVPVRAEISETYQLTEDDRHQLALESNDLAKALMNYFSGDKFNTAALGNMVPQLHIHHIVRYKSDAAWPKPVWGAMPAIAYTDAQLDSLLSPLKEHITATCSGFQPC